MLLRFTRKNIYKYHCYFYNSHIHLILTFIVVYCSLLFFLSMVAIMLKTSDNSKLTKRTQKLGLYEGPKEKFGVQKEINGEQEGINEKIEEIYEEDEIVNKEQEEVKDIETGRFFDTLNVLVKVQEVKFEAYTMLQSM